MVDVVVVGGGAMGSAAAWQLARLGADVVLLEQFGPGHGRGSSHGSSRIVRLSYDDPFYVDLAAAAYQQWDELEADSGEQLLTWTGVVDHGAPSTVDAMARLLSTRGHATDLLDPLGLVAIGNALTERAGPHDEHLLSVYARVGRRNRECECQLARLRATAGHSRRIYCPFSQ